MIRIHVHICISTVVLLFQLFPFIHTSCPKKCANGKFTTSWVELDPPVVFLVTMPIMTSMTGLSLLLTHDISLGCYLEIAGRKKKYD